ncbi:MAG: c-type cytochrome [Bacteroidetes bacterium]|nr:c-type cytochrome [Bacteroidota bacterium]
MNLEKLSINQMLKKLNFYKNSLIALTIAIFISFTTHAQDSANKKAKVDGAGLFKAKCASCHHPHKDGTGPKLYKVRDKWSTGGAKEGSIYTWVNNWQNAAAIDPYAAQVSTVKPTAMSAFPELKKEEIDGILDYVDAQPEQSAVVPAGTPQNDQPSETSSDASGIGIWMWVLLGGIFITIILAVGGVRRQLNNAVREKEGQSVKEFETYLSEFKSFAWKYRLQVGLASLVLLISILVSFFQGLSTIGVTEAYQPSQPIKFPHSAHAGVNGIDCKYCHSSVTKSKSAGIPTVNVCMNCHKQINGEGKPFKAEIDKIYAAAGFINGEYKNVSKPIVWNKVHVLPDHVYFNHSQHVVVGGVDCKQCHGDMTKTKDAVKVQTISELNAIEGNIKLTKPTLTMGWCIECHDKKEISKGPLADKKDGYYNEIHRRLLNNDKSLYKKYLKDNKVSVSELGGWECAKCHY